LVLAGGEEQASDEVVGAMDRRLHAIYSGHPAVEKRVAEHQRASRLESGTDDDIFGTVGNDFCGSAGAFEAAPRRGLKNSNPTGEHIRF